MLIWEKTKKMRQDVNLKKDKEDETRGWFEKRQRR